MWAKQSACPLVSRGSSNGEPVGRCALLRNALLYSALILLVVFGLYELVERTWLVHSRMEALHISHTVRGIVSSLLVGAVVAWTIIRGSPSILSISPIEEDWADRARLTEGERTLIYAQWFIAMRWVAVLVAGVLILIAVKLTDLLPSENWWPLLFTLSTLALCNLFYTGLVRWGSGSPAVLLLQGYIDLFILTVLLHFSGGVENPLATVMIFHVIIAGILLSRRHCYGIAATGSLLFTLLVAAEYAGLWEHQTLKVFPHFELESGEIFHAAHQPLYAVSRVVLQTTILFLTGYFVTSLSERMRYNERRLEAMADRAVADRQLLERALETTGAGLRVCGGNREVSWSSKLWNDWFVCQPEESCPGCAELNRDNSPMQKCLEDGRIHVTELALSGGNCPPRLLEHNRSPRYFQITTAPLLDGNGQVRQVVEFAQDVSEQKRTQEQVIRAGKLAAIGELAGQVAHEVNNPTAIISAKASLLLADYGKEMPLKAAQEIGKIRDLATRVARIAQGLLSYCRPSAGNRSVLDLRGPIRKAIGLIDEHARRNGVRIEDELPEQMPSVYGNPEELEQVFLNLFLNAVDAMPEGGWLRISTAEKANCMCRGRTAVAVLVEDTGCGIPEEIRERVFEPFFTTKKDGRGTGLGLSICLGLIRSHEGEIQIASKVFQGTQVTVKLPVYLQRVIHEEVAHG